MADKTRFQVGDVVHIVDEPVKIASSWVPDMNQYCGREAKILYAVRRSCGTTGSYNLDVDGQKFAWNDEAFQEFYGTFSTPVIDETEFLRLLG